MKCGWFKRKRFFLLCFWLLAPAQDVTVDTIAVVVDDQTRTQGSHPDRWEKVSTRLTRHSPTLLAGTQRVVSVSLSFVVIRVSIFFGFFDRCTITPGSEHGTAPELRCQMHQVKLKSLFFCWDIVTHDAQLGDAACTDQDEAEERDVVHHELC